MTNPREAGNRFTTPIVQYNTSGAFNRLCASCNETRTQLGGGMIPVKGFKQWSCKSCRDIYLLKHPSKPTYVISDEKIHRVKKLHLERA